MVPDYNSFYLNIFVKLASRFDSNIILNFQMLILSNITNTLHLFI